MLLPTPAVNDMGADKTVEWWDEWAPRQKSATGRRAVHGKSLSIEVQRLLPTPLVADGMGGRTRSFGQDGGTLETISRELAQAADDLEPEPEPEQPADERLLPTPTAMDSVSSGGGYGGQTNVTLTDAVVRQPSRWGIYSGAIEAWEAVTRPAPSPTRTGRKGTQQLAPAFSEWMMGLPAGWVTDDSIGLTRNEQLRALGNGVCPQQAALATRLWQGMLEAPLVVQSEASA